MNTGDRRMETGDRKTENGNGYLGILVETATNKILGLVGLSTQKGETPFLFSTGIRVSGACIDFIVGYRREELAVRRVAACGTKHLPR